MNEMWTTVVGEFDLVISLMSRASRELGTFKFLERSELLALLSGWKRTRQKSMIPRTRVFATCCTCRCIGSKRTSERNLVELHGGIGNAMSRAKSRSIQRCSPEANETP